MKLKRYISAAAAILAWTAFTGSAYADANIDSINGALTPFPDLTITQNDIGWVYSPTESYMLSGISSDFSIGGAVGQTVTLSFWSGLPNSGGTLLDSGTFSSGAGILGVTFGPDIAVTAGDSYFVGLSGTAGIGVDMANAAFLVTGADPVAPGVTYIPSGFYSDYPAATTDFATNVPLSGPYCQPGSETCNNAFAAPILYFQGVPDESAVPEPSMAFFVLPVLAGFVVVRRLRSSPKYL